MIENRWLLVFLGLLMLVGCNASSPGGKSLSQQQAEALKLSDAGQRARRLAQVAEKQHKAGDLLAVRSALSIAGESARSVKDPASRAAALTYVAGYYVKLGQNEDDAKALLREAAKAAEDVSDPDVKIRVLSELAAATGAQLKNATLAASYLKTAEAAAGGLALEAVVTKVTALSRIAVAYQKLERAADAERVIAAAQETARGVSDPRQKCDALAEIGAALSRMKQTAGAQAAFDEAELAVAEIAEADGQAYALLNLARGLATAGRKESARAILKQAMDAADKVTDGSVRGPLNDEIEAARKAL
jgi:tetratricopeptide (TPR) repeat protein